MENKVLEALLDLNKVLMMEGFESDFSISLADADFELFVHMTERVHKPLISYPELVAKLSEVTEIKLAGPGSYFLVKRQGKQ